MVLALTFRSVIHLELVFVDGMRKGSSVTLLHVEPQSSRCSVPPLCWAVLGSRSSPRGVCPGVGETADEADGGQLHEETQASHESRKENRLSPGLRKPLAVEVVFEPSSGGWRRFR